MFAIWRLSCSSIYSFIATVNVRTQTDLNHFQSINFFHMTTIDVCVASFFFQIQSMCIRTLNPLLCNYFYFRSPFKKRWCKFGKITHLSIKHSVTTAQVYRTISWWFSKWWNLCLQCEKLTAGYKTMENCSLFRMCTLLTVSKYNKWLAIMSGTKSNFGNVTQTFWIFISNFQLITKVCNIKTNINRFLLLSIDINIGGKIICGVKTHLICKNVYGYHSKKSDVTLKTMMKY